VYFLEQGELADAAVRLEGAAVASSPQAPDLRARVQARRQEWQRQARLAPPDRIPPPSAEDPWDEVPGWNRAVPGRVVEDEGGRRLVGHPASPGRASGPARLVRTAEDFARFQRGDVLVAPIASPAWTVLLPLAAGLVTDVGGAASHCSLVAREYAIPAVMATGIATQVIRDGQLIRLDGSRGVVYL
jgi:pyruvate,water dikinase